MTLSDRLKPFGFLFLILTSLLGGIPTVDAGTSPKTAPAQLLSGSGIKDRIIQETHEKILWTLPDKSQVWLTKKPRRAVVLLTSLLELWYETGGQAIARCTGKLKVPEPAMGLPQVGNFNHPNAEKIIALQPDLVISSNLPAFQRLIPILEENQIEYAYFDYVNFYDYSRILTLFSKLNRTEDRVTQALGNMAARISKIQDAVREKPKPRVLVLFSMANSVSCELENSQTGVMLSMLGAENIIPARFATGNRTRVQFSLERIVSLDPDFILLNTMGDVAECTERLKTEFAGNPAWNGLRAIRENRFFILPKEYFLYKSNAKFPDALAYLANLLYGKER